MKNSLLRNIPKKKIIMLCLVVLVTIIPVNLRPQNYPADDSYFYLQIASNFYQGNGFTFNNITPTNGFHPLWMVVCVFAYLIVGGDKLAALRTVIFFQQLFFLALLYYVYAISRQLKTNYFILPFSVLNLYFLTGLYGSEAYINGFFVTLTAYTALHILDINKSKKLATYLVGIFAGLSTLARLDNIFFAIPLFIFLILAKKKKGFLSLSMIKYGLGIVLPYVLIVFAYLLSNWLSFGHILPISGAIKSTFPNLTWNPSALSFPSKVLVLYAFLSLAYGLFIEKKQRIRFLCFTFSTSVILHAAYLVFMTKHTTQWAWYYVLAVMNFSLTIGFLLEWLKKWFTNHSKSAARVFQGSVLTLAFTVILFGVFLSWTRWNNPDALKGFNPFRIQPKVATERWPQQLAYWLRDYLPQNSRIMVWDSPGILAFYSTHAVLPIDGLVSDYQYNEDILKLGIEVYLEMHGIDYWIGPIPDEAPIERINGIIIPGTNQIFVECFSPLYGKSAGMITIRSEDLVILVQEVVNHPFAEPWGVWKISH